MTESTQPGNPNNWPSKIARSYPDLDVAVDRLLNCIDNGNMRFAITEFARERARMAAAAPPSLLEEREEHRKE